MSQRPPWSRPGRPDKFLSEYTHAEMLTGDALTDSVPEAVEVTGDARPPDRVPAVVVVIGG